MGTVASGASLPTGHVGPQTLGVVATDLVGHVTRTSASYDVSYRVCLLYDGSRAHKAGSTVAITLRLCDVAGANMSNSGITVKAVRLLKRTTRTGFTPETRAIESRRTLPLRRCNREVRL